MTTMKAEVLKLKKRYKKVTKARYFYNTSKDLQKRSNRIVSWSIIETKKSGVFIFKFVFSRTHKMTVKEWAELWTKQKKRRGKKPYQSLYTILTDVVIPNISLSPQVMDDWKLIDVIGWTLVDLHANRHKSMAASTKSKET